VFFCCLNILAGLDPIIPVDKNGRLKTEDDWKTSLACLAKPDYFLGLLNAVKPAIDAEKVPAANFKPIRGILADPDFTTDKLFNLSKSAAGICDFVKNIVMYYDVFCSVEPKKIAVREANARLSAANEKKAEMDELVARLTGELNILLATFKEAMDTKEAAEAEAKRCEGRLDLAQRLVGALGTESVRWN
jgi:dynein heavy chain